MTTKSDYTIVDWSYWLNIREMKAWQAVALTLGISPTCVTPSGDEWKGDLATDSFFEEDSFPNAEVRVEFGKRLRLLLSNLSDHHHFAPGTLSLSCVADNGVRLEQVAAWFIHIGRDSTLPSELVNAARPPATNSDVLETGGVQTWQQYARKRFPMIIAKHRDWTREACANALADEMQKKKKFGRGGKVVTVQNILRNALKDAKP